MIRNRSAAHLTGVLFGIIGLPTVFGIGFHIHHKHEVAERKQALENAIQEEAPVIETYREMKNMDPADFISAYVVCHGPDTQPTGNLMYNAIRQFGNDIDMVEEGGVANTPLPDNFEAHRERAKLFNSVAFDPRKPVKGPACPAIH